MVNRAAEFFAQSPIDGKRGDRDYRVQRDRVNAAETGRARQFVDVDQTDTTVPGDFSDDWRKTRHPSQRNRFVNGGTVSLRGGG